MDNFILNYEPTPDPIDLKFLNAKIFEHNYLKIGEYRYEKIVFFIRDSNLNIVAGLYGYTGLGWLYVDVLWVEKELRFKGFGTRLMEAAELESIHRGCHDVYLYTYSFQEPAFYIKLGYQVFGHLDNFPDGHAKLFMKKVLSK